VNKKKTTDETHINSSGVMTKIRKKPFLIFAAAQLVILLIFFAALYSSASNQTSVDVSLSDWQSEKIKFSNGSWYADSKTVKTNKKIDLLVGPYIHLDKGSYLVTIDYDCTAEQTAAVTIDGSTSVFIKSGTARLYKTLHSTSFRFQATNDVNNAEIRVKYDGNGSLKIRNIEIRRDHAGAGRAFTIVLALFVLCDLVYLYYERLKENKTTVFGIICIMLLSSLPLFFAGIGRGHDIDVHLMRIEGIVGELRRGVFPVRMSSDWIQGYGYPTSIYYGDLMLYLPAVLRIAGFDVVSSYKVYVFFVNALTAVISYYCFKRIFDSSRYGLILSLAYSTAAYRMMNLYIRSAVGEFTAALFFPLIAFGIYGIYTNSPKNKKQFGEYSLALAVGMTGLICNHMLSTEMTVFILVVLCIVLAVKTFQFERLKALLLAVGQTVLLSAFFVVPFLDYYLNVKVRINDRMHTGSSDMKQSKGLTLAEYFSFFRDPFSEFSTQRNHRLILTPGLVLMLALVIAIYFIVKFGLKKSGLPILIYTGFSVLILFVASNLFPWDAFNHGNSFELAFAQVQFPWRYVGMSLIFLTLVLGCVLKTAEQNNIGIPEKNMVITALLCVMAVSVFTGQYLEGASFVKYYDGSDLNTSFVGMGEYIRSNSNYRSINGKVTADKGIKAEIEERDGCHIELKVKSEGKKGKVTLPVFNYKGYEAKTDSGEKLSVSDGDNKQLAIEIPSGYNGAVTVDYKSPVSWRFAEIVSLLTVLYYLFFRKYISGLLAKKTEPRKI